MRPLAVVGAAILAGGRCLVARRGPRMREPGKWEFPGGKVEAGEDPREALKREIAEELGLEIEVGEHLGRGESGGENSDESSGEATGPGRAIRLDVYCARRLGGRLVLAEHEAAAWIGPGEIHTLDWAAADRPVLRALEARLRARRPRPEAPTPPRPCR